MDIQQLRRQVHLPGFFDQPPAGVRFMRQVRKSARVPTLALLARLHARNEYFINSRLPLHEAIINQTGNNERQRKTFLQDAWNAAFANRLRQWAPEQQQELIF